MKRFRMLVDLDSIFDTRLGTLIQIDPLKAAQLAKEYKHTFNEHFGELDEEFQKKFKERDVETLMVSPVTEVPLQMSGMIADIYAWNLKNEEKKNLEIMLNVYPYDLDQEAINKIIVELKRELLYSDVNIIPIQLDITTLTPNECNTHDVHIVVTHEYDVWLAALVDQEVIPQTPFHDMTCVGPRTIRHVDPAIIEAKGLEYKDGPFRTMEFYFGGMLELLLIEPSIFRSSVLNENFVKAGTEIAEGKEPDITNL